MNPSNGCNVDLNDLSMHFKNATKKLLEELYTSLHGFEYSFADAYEMDIRIDADLRELGDTFISLNSNIRITDHELFNHCQGSRSRRPHAVDQGG